MQHIMHDRGAHELVGSNFIKNFLQPNLVGLSKIYTNPTHIIIISKST